jgi:hypothetical protein
LQLSLQRSQCLVDVVISNNPFFIARSKHTREDTPLGLQSACLR